MISREELIKRGAVFKDGGLKVESDNIGHSNNAPMVMSDKIDTSMIAGAINQLSEVMRSVLEVQTKILEKLEKKDS